MIAAAFGVEVEPGGRAVRPGHDMVEVAALRGQVAAGVGAETVPEADRGGQPVGREAAQPGDVEQVPGRIGEQPVDRVPGCSASSRITPAGTGADLSASCPGVSVNPNSDCTETTTPIVTLGTGRPGQLIEREPASAAPSPTAPASGSTAGEPS